MLYPSKTLKELQIPIPSDAPEPAPNVCEFCGKQLPYNAIVIFGKFIQWLPMLCDCEEAITWQKKQEEEETKREQKELDQREREERRERIKHLLGTSGIKKRFTTRTFTAFHKTAQNERAFDLARRYVSKFDSCLEQGVGIYFEGSCGVGKTHLAVAIALQLIGEGYPVIFRTFGELLSELRKTYNPKSTVMEEQILSVFLSADLLIIDDLGKEKPSEWTLDRLYYIINDRYENMKPTIITANYSREDLIKRLNPKGGDGKTAEAVISRLQETTTAITMTGEDWRTKRPGGAK